MYCETASLINISGLCSLVYRLGSITIRSSAGRFWSGERMVSLLSNLLVDSSNYREKYEAHVQKLKADENRQSPAPSGFFSF